jgi:glycosyltransferase involved in cell wall biosynthesis
MACGNCVVVNDTPENVETIGDAGLTYSGATGAASLRDTLNHLIADPAQVEYYRQLAQARVARHYTWDSITDQYEALFKKLCHMSPE